MKKIMALLVILMMFVPLVNVKAIEGNYYVYGVGDEVNFYTYQGDQTGLKTTIISDPGADSKYVRVLATGYNVGVGPYAEPHVDDLTPFKGTYVYRQLLDAMNGQTSERTFEYAKDLETDGNLELLTLDELKTIFGATSSDNGETYTIDVQKWGSTFNAIGGSYPGMYTETLTSDKSQVWVIKFTYESETNKAIKTITVEKEPVESSNYWEAVPVIYLDKTHDCVTRDTKNVYACYSCNGDYVWLKKGTEGASCVEETAVKKKDKCVKNAKTGIENYVFEFVAVAGVCGIALVLVKRNTLFKKI